MRSLGGPRMRTRPPLVNVRRSLRPVHHGHSKAQCLKVLRRLSEFLDNELSGSICQEIRKHLGACPKCEIFVSSLRQTVSLCRHSRTPRLSPSIKARLRREIHRAVASL
ncbi:MAG: anti-sigma factor family protein [Nitrospiraceae bacterium]